MKTLERLSPEFSSDYRAYRANVARALNIQAPNTYSPNLTLLDAMLGSLEIKLTLPGELHTLLSETSNDNNTCFSQLF